MYKRIVSAALVFGAAALAPPHASAQTQAFCLDRDQMVAQLQLRFGETLHGGGLQGPSRLLELWASKETGSFTLLGTRPDGISCVLATGTDWHSALPVTTTGEDS
ncbi:hypothetical protein [Vannielia litorea]|uniref:Uncharacterized protein n=1 Tax=Vannielia litorea TaxID=1217970 RepID=A0A1N6HL57_9RHOB|nr:hypothetical protein [Vannielia litorea]SIO20501.1 hypothetical protein SAMN05444002_3480 [Vannielia litorea]